MTCYECQQASKKRDAVALCHHCSAGLCVDHALILGDPITAQYPVCKTVILPLRARVFLCSTCREALRQTSESGDGAQVATTTPTVEERDEVGELSRR